MEQARRLPPPWRLSPVFAQSRFFDRGEARRIFRLAVRHVLLDRLHGPENRKQGHFQGQEPRPLSPGSGSAPDSLPGRLPFKQGGQTRSQAASFRWQSWPSRISTRVLMCGGRLSWRPPSFSPCSAIVHVLTNIGPALTRTLARGYLGGVNGNCMLLKGLPPATASSSNSVSSTGSQDLFLRNPLLRSRAKSDTLSSRGSSRGRGCREEAP
jgi:hypothetical protein